VEAKESPHLRAGSGRCDRAREFDPAKPVDQQETALVYHYDHLGSIESITPFGSTDGSYAADGAGKGGRFSEDAWGQRRNPTTWSGAPTATDDGGADKDESGTVTSTVVAYKAGLGHAGDGTAPDVLSNRKDLFKEYATSLSDALSEASGKPVDKKIIAKLFSTADGLKPGGKEPNADDKAFRELAVSLGYDNNYKPEQGQSKVSDKFPNLTKKQIQKAINTIKDALKNDKKEKMWW
jgi:hypothetical protein